MKKIFVLIVISIFAFQVANAQDDTEKKSPISFTSNFQTNHLWRGLIVSDKPIFTALTTIKFDKAGHFTGGFWGGMAISNTTNNTLYKEIDYYLQYSNAGFTIGLWDLFNTTDAKAPDVWNYKEKETGHIIDLRMSYNFGESFPMTLEADVLLYGSADIQYDSKGDVKHRYSTYVQLSYPFVANSNVNLNGFIGSGIALNGDTHLYGDGKNSFDIVNLGITASKTITIGGHNFPVSATTLWNPSVKVARVQVAITLF